MNDGAIERLPLSFRFTLHVHSLTGRRQKVYFLQADYNNGKEDKYVISITTRNRVATIHG